MMQYIPKNGDIVWLDFNSQTCNDIQSTRPALIISPESYNRKTQLCLVMPITNEIKRNPFEAEISYPNIKGAVLCDQMHSIDWKARKAKYIRKISADVFEDIINRFKVLITT